MQVPLALLLWRGPEDLSMAAPTTVPFAHREAAAPEAASEPKAGFAVSQATGEGPGGAEDSPRMLQSSQVCHCGSGALCMHHTSVSTWVFVVRYT